MISFVSFTRIYYIMHMKKNLYLFALFCISLSLFSKCNKEQKCVPDNSTQALVGGNIPLAEEIADKWISQKSPETLAWNWEPAVLMFAITKLYNYTGEAKYFEYYKNWINSLSMFGMPMINAYTSIGDKKYIDLLAEQMIIFGDLLQDKDAGLFRHAWINGNAVPEEPVFWARGNSWIVVSLTELLSVLPEGYQKLAQLNGIYLSLLNAVEKYQDTTSGLWFTVLNRPGETYLETSGSALFNYGILKGMNEGMLDKNVHSTVVEKAIIGVKAKIDISSGKPVVIGISKGTQPDGFDNYNGVEVGNDIPYGVGGVILALIEYQRFLNE